MATQNPKPIIQDGDEVREMTVNEYAQYQTDQTENTVKQLANADAKTAKQIARQTVLDKLGLSADEAKALLG